MLGQPEIQLSQAGMYNSRLSLYVSETYEPEPKPFEVNGSAATTFKVLGNIPCTGKINGESANTSLEVAILRRAEIGSAYKNTSLLHSLSVNL